MVTQRCGHSEISTCRNTSHEAEFDCPHNVHGMHQYQEQATDSRSEFKQRTKPLFEWDVDYRSHGRMVRKGLGLGLGQSRTEELQALIWIMLVILIIQISYREPGQTRILAVCGIVCSLCCLFVVQCKAQGSTKYGVMIAAYVVLVFTPQPLFSFTHCIACGVLFVIITCYRKHTYSYDEYEYEYEYER